MGDHFSFVADDEGIRQGDIIHSKMRNGKPEDVWGVVLTADCDIAQKKAGDQFSWLEIVRCEYYLEKYWARDQLKRLIEKQSRVACDGLNARLRRSDLHLSEIDAASLSIWLAENDAEEILRQTGEKEDKKLSSLLSALRISAELEGDGSSLDRLRQAWTLIGRKEESQRQSVKEAFDAERGFPDYLVVPELPNTMGYGFVVLLRSIHILPSRDLFPSQVDARISGRPEAFYRMGRFGDSLRFSISQKLAFLFSRIGLSVDFENACDAATTLAVESLYGNAGGSE
ncbi:hypothetical protein [Parvibaculum sp.]|jgi:hypothetical protein|uniref:hypothetical protein n=1 Tax=Parvibaculum sp. TaxID=2024848 RepID=UPI002FD988D4